MILFKSENELKFLNIISYPNIEITENQFTFISGKSGCGKSTYLKMLNRTVIPSSGNIIYKNNDIKNIPVLDYRKKVLLIPQEVFLIDGTIKENFDFYYDAREEKHIEEEKIKVFLDICCLDFNPDTLCQNLSGGEKQRVFIAIFLSCVKDVLLLDEPTAALDEKTSVQLLSNIKTFCLENRFSAVCVSHNKNLVQKFQDNTINLGD